MEKERNRTVGFVILTWNSEKVIEKCLQSIVGLEMITPVVVVVDNGSSDATACIIHRFKSEKPEIFSVITYEENIGTTVSRNAGLKKLREAAPQYYCILDSDTQVNDAAFLKLISELDSHPCYGLIGPTMVSSDGTPQMSARCFPTLMEKMYKAIPIKSIQARGRLWKRRYRLESTWTAMLWIIL